jgi:hypothetical protein
MSDYSNFRRNRAKSWAEHYQPEIDSLRGEGKYEPSTWENMKNKVGGFGLELALDGAEFYDDYLRYGGSGRGPSGPRSADPDDTRNEILEREKARAVKDHERKLKEPSWNGSPTSAWSALRGNGEY